MKFLCGSCRTKYQISDDKVRGKILTIRCKKCSAKILVRESLAVSGGTAVAPVAEDEAASRKTGSARPQTAARRPEARAESRTEPSAHSLSASATRTGGSAALASAYDFAMGQGASESDDMPTSIAPVPANLEIAGVEWYVAVDGAQQGPFAFAEVVQKVETRQLIGRHYVWHDGMENWTRLRDVADLAKYLPVPRKVPPPPPPTTSGAGGGAEVVELAAHRAQLGQDLVHSGAPSPNDRADELDRALNDVLGLEDSSDTAKGAAALSSTAQVGGSLASTTEDIEDDMLASDDLFANIPRAAGADDVHRESTRFFVAAAGVNKQRKRRRIGVVSSIAAGVALLGFIGGWALGLFSIELPGIGDPFANMRRTLSPAEDGPVDELSAKELALLKGKKKKRRRRRRRSSGDRSAAAAGGGDFELPADYVDDGAGSARGAGPRGSADGQKIGIGPLQTGGAGRGDALPEAKLPTTSPDLPVVDQSSLTQEAVAKVVQQNSMSVRYCYSQSLKGSKNLRGKLIIKLRVEPSGKVSRTQVETRQFKGTTLATCITDKIRKWTFPRFEGEAREFLVPFVLEKSSF